MRLFFGHKRSYLQAAHHSKYTGLDMLIHGGLSQNSLRILAGKRHMLKADETAYFGSS
jgi:hypothetical protein